MSWDAYRGYWDAHWRNVGERYFVTDMDQTQYNAYLHPVLVRFANRPIASVVDLGCGNGLALPAIRALWPDARYIGLDICADAIANAKAKYPADTWQVMDGPQITEKADLILVHSVFTHIGIDDTRRYLDEIKLALNPGGRANLSIHTDTDGLVTGNIGRIDIQPAYFEKILAEHGYRILSVYESRQRYYEVEPC